MLLNSFSFYRYYLYLAAFGVFQGFCYLGKLVLFFLVLNFFRVKNSNKVIMTVFYSYIYLELETDDNYISLRSGIRMVSFKK